MPSGIYKRPSLKQRLYKKVNKNGPLILLKLGKCWIWTGSLDSWGYGQIYYKYKRFQTHRLSFKIKYGEIPRGMLICHKCDNPACIRPKHLFLGTAKDNIQDCIKKNRRGLEQTKLSKKDILIIRKLYKTKKYYQKEIAEMFEMSISQISNIINRRSWIEV